MNDRPPEKIAFGVIGVGLSLLFTVLFYGFITGLKIFEESMKLLDLQSIIILTIGTTLLYLGYSYTVYLLFKHYGPQRKSTSRYLAYFIHGAPIIPLVLLLTNIWYFKFELFTPHVSIPSLILAVGITSSYMFLGLSAAATHLAWDDPATSSKPKIPWFYCLLFKNDSAESDN